MTEPTLLLIHGLGATGRVWLPLEAELAWPGRVIAPDLPGHGAADWTGDYTVGALAAAVSADCESEEPVIVVGHSLGGAVGICLASGFFRPVPVAVLGLGIKVSWTDDDVAGMARVAAKGIRWFDSELEAVDRYLRQSGLHGVVEATDPIAVGGVVQEGETWRVAQDPATFAQRPLDMRGLLDAATCPVILGAGEHDAMVSERDLADFTNEPRIAAGRGHNVQVEDPAWVAGLASDLGRLRR